MVKKIFFAALVLSCCLRPAFASENPDSANPGLTRSLEANRSLLDQYQNEYLRLKSESAQNPSAALNRKMRDLEDKMKALEEDSEELQSFLPPDRGAAEFLSDLMTKKAHKERLRQAEKAADFLKETSMKESLRATSPAAEDTWRMHERALKLISEERYEEALSLYEEIILKNPDDDEAYVIMGHTLLLTGQYQKAERAFQNAVSIDPQNIREITPFYENRVLQNPDDDMACAQLGYAYAIVGDLLKARDAFNESLRINPQNRPAQSGLAHVERILSRR